MLIEPLGVLNTGHEGGERTADEAALRLSPQYSPAAINLADLYRSLGRDSDSESVLRAAIAAAPRCGASLFARISTCAAEAIR